MITVQAVMSSVGQDSPLGRTIAYGDMRYDLMATLDQLIGEGHVARTAPTPEAWSDLCMESRIRVDEAIATHARPDAIDRAPRI